MSESAMQIILGTMMQDKKVNVSLTSGSSPRTMYQMMVPYVKDKPQFKDVDYYLFDEAPEAGEKKGQPVRTGLKCRNCSSRMQIFLMKRFIVQAWKTTKHLTKKLRKPVVLMSC